MPYAKSTYGRCQGGGSKQQNLCVASFAAFFASAENLCQIFLRYTHPLSFVYQLGKLFGVYMEITFANERLQKLCEDSAAASKRFGTSSVKPLVARLKALRASTCVTDLVTGSPHPIKPHTTGGTKFRKVFSGYEYLFSLKFDSKNRLVFQSIEDPQPLKESGEIDWSKVTKIRIVFLRDYHE